MDENLIQFCIKNGFPFAITFDKPWNTPWEEYEEYITDTRAGHPVKDDYIVRHCEETQRIKDKEP